MKNADILLLKIQETKYFFIINIKNIAVIVLTFFMVALFGCFFYSRINQSSWKIFKITKFSPKIFWPAEICKNKIGSNYKHVYVRFVETKFIYIKAIYFTNSNMKTQCWFLLKSNIQKQPSRGVPRKKCSENMQQIYRRTLIPKSDFL